MWKSHRQLKVTLSTMELEYLALTEDTNQRFAGPGQNRSDWTGLAWFGLDWTGPKVSVQSKPSAALGKPVQSDGNRRTEQSGPVQSKGDLGPVHGLDWTENALEFSV